MIIIGCVVAATHPREIALLGCALSLFGLGCARVALIPANSVEDGRVVSAQASVVREPELHVDQQRLAVKFDDGTTTQIDVSLQPRFLLGDRVQVQCVLRKPQAFDDFAYDRYLARFHIDALCDRGAQVAWIAEQQSWQTSILAIKKHASSSVRHLLPAPEQAVVLGMVFGVDHQLPSEIADQFRTTGTTHLLVISGSQIVLIVAVCMRLLQQMPLRRRTSLLLIALFLVAYLVMTGWQASVLRAALCACCLFGVELLGRTGGGLRMLLYVAVLMVAVNPYLLLYDAGFQLSFLATGGIICLATRFQKLLTFLPESGGFRTATATSLAAMVPTTPLIAYSFHTFSVVGLCANMLAVPLSAVLTIGGFAFSMLAAIFPPAAKLCAPALYTLSHLFLSIVSWFAQLPYASVDIPL
jgi:competence protein ComEC